MRREWMTDEERRCAEKDAKWLRIDGWAFAIVQGVAFIVAVRSLIAAG